MNFRLIPNSDNSKLKGMATSISSSDTCPNSCPLKESKSCYAMLGPLLWHWKKTDSGQFGTDNWDSFCESVKNLPDNTVFRLNSAGDLVPNSKGEISHKKVNKLINALKSKDCSWTYTHYSMDSKKNREIVKKANSEGFTINLSADNLDEADELKALNIAPVVVIAAIDSPKSFYTPKGNKVVVCPETYRKDIVCKNCKLCARQRSTIVAFPAHGVKKKTAEKIALNLS